ncbi:Crp/Fnr family transcriptional regulator [Candidatus Igneacidithiobacillus taiwanensis]|uniref:Crp/Fnr family transcriptional regulator n=1 Tax=Candidatus Igneacidithiobacillus taiwanensis TaxID=1945924 RepID=UPI00289FABFC|nr:Crp/Fnr family transcriptional regulator [Candidatus Igneacidithiobacillus taiwanensis]MCE5359448.1 Crp/Fnr family transcriptional regulator [Acidithiobacillus sp.]
MKTIGLSDCSRCQMRGESIFAGLDPVELCSLGMEVQDLDCQANDVLYRSGEPARYAYTLREGAVKLVKNLASGQEVILRLLHHGDLFGFEGLHETQHRHDAISLAPGKLCRLDLGELQRLSERQPKIRAAILQRWHDALRDSEERVVELGAKRAEARLATFLLQWAQRYPHLRSLPFPLTRQDLAAFLGLSVEHVSRIMAEFKRQDWLREHRGQLEILAAARLQEIAGKKPE